VLDLVVEVELVLIAEDEVLGPLVDVVLIVEDEVFALVVVIGPLVVTLVDDDEALDEVELEEGPVAEELQFPY
jgi:hypothetical protein